MWLFSFCAKWTGRPKNSHELNSHLKTDEAVNENISEGNETAVSQPSFRWDPWPLSGLVTITNNNVSTTPQSVLLIPEHLVIQKTVNLESYRPCEHSHPLFTLTQVKTEAFMRLIKSKIIKPVRLFLSTFLSEQWISEGWTAKLD